MLIAKDTPKELIEIFNVIDIDSMRESDVQNKIEQLEGLVAKVLKRRMTKPACINVDLPIPKAIANMTITYNMNVGPGLIKIAIPIIKEYIRKNLPLRRAI